MSNITDADLIALSSKAATEYHKEKNIKALDLTDQTTIVNSVAHGFFMGWKACEKKDANHEEHPSVS